MSILSIPKLPAGIGLTAGGDSLGLDPAYVTTSQGDELGFSFTILLAIQAAARVSAKDGLQAFLHK